MAKALVMTVGTGTGGPDKVESLKKALVQGIINSNPEKVYFVITEKSAELAKDIMAEKELKSRHAETLEIKDCDDFYSTYDKLKEEFRKIRISYENVSLNYTSGTKTMASASVVAAIICGFDQLEVIGGTGREGGIVKRGYERPASFKTTRAIAEIVLNKELVPMFNIYHFSHVKKKLEWIKGEIDIEWVDPLIHLVEAYDFWDKFNHVPALESMKKGIEGLKGKIEDPFYRTVTNNRGFLDQICRAKGDLVEGAHDRLKLLKFFVADVINNAERRAEEHKYDDAVARLYRAIEMLAEYELLRFGFDIDSAKASFEKVNPGSEQLTAKWGSMISESGKLKIGLKDKYSLLKDLGSPAGSLYDDSLKRLLDKRNISILAHGINPVGEEAYRSLMSKTIDMASKFEGLSDLEKLRSMAKFPNLPESWFLELAINWKCN
ncbi:MAG: TIGR02710 family CRISPR-associated CARF protein [Candidatus Methanosuratincola petrocarbonis]